MSESPTTLERQVTITPEKIVIRGEVLAELRARHRIYRMIRDTAGEYTQEEFYWSEELPLADRALFAQAEEFTRALLDHLDAPRKDHERGESSERLLDELRSTWPPDVAESFDPEFGVLPFQTEWLHFSFPGQTETSQTPEVSRTAEGGESPDDASRRPVG